MLRPGARGRELRPVATGNCRTGSRLEPIAVAMTSKMTSKMTSNVPERTHIKSHKMIPTAPAMRTRTRRAMGLVGFSKKADSTVLLELQLKVGSVDEVLDIDWNSREMP